MLIEHLIASTTAVDVFASNDERSRAFRRAWTLLPRRIPCNKKERSRTDTLRPHEGNGGARTNERSDYEV